MKDALISTGLTLFFIFLSGWIGRPFTNGEALILYFVLLTYVRLCGYKNGG